MKISYQYICKTYYLSLSVVILMLNACTSSHDLGNKNIEDLGKTILNSLKTDNHELFKKYVFTAHEVNYVIEADSTRKPRKEKMLKQWEEVYPKLLGADKKIKLKASQEGLNNWEKVEFSKITFNTYKEYGARNVRLEFTNGDFIGSIRLNNLIKSDRGWFIMAVPKYQEYERLND